MTDYHSTGKTTLTPEVLLTIARMAALEVKGVKHMAPVKGGVNSLFRRGNDGVRIVVEDSIALIDLYLVLNNDVNIREIRQARCRAMALMALGAPSLVRRERYLAPR